MGRIEGEERGTVLLLMPVAVLIFLVLAAISVDFAVVFLAKRELSNAAAGAANDAATRALDLDHYYAQQTARIDPVAAEAVASASLAGEALDHLSELTAGAAADGDVVTVTVSAEVATIFAPAVGGPRSVAVSATAQATARAS